MTGKLMKYEFRSVFKQMGIIWAVLPAVAILASFSGWIYKKSALFEGNRDIFKIVLSNIPMFLYVGLFIALIAATIFVVVMRFYKGLLKEEGYLMHTLPVNEWQLIASKGIVTTVTVLISMLLAAVSIVLLNVVGNLSAIGEFFSSVGELFRDYPISVLYVFEGLILALAAIMTEVYKIYASLSVGQLMAKNRILWSVGAYIGIGIAMTLIGSILVTVFGNPLLEMTSHIFSDFTYNQMIQSFMAGGIVYFALQIAIFHIASERILSKYLNLE